MRVADSRAAMSIDTKHSSTARGQPAAGCSLQDGLAGEASCCSSACWEGLDGVMLGKKLAEACTDVCKWWHAVCGHTGRATSQCSVLMHRLHQSGTISAPHAVRLLTIHDGRWFLLACRADSNSFTAVIQRPSLHSSCAQAWAAGAAEQRRVGSGAGQRRASVSCQKVGTGLRRL